MTPGRARRRASRATREHVLGGAKREGAQTVWIFFGFFRVFELFVSQNETE